MPSPTKISPVTQYREDWLTITKEARERCQGLYLSAINKLFKYTTEQIAVNMTKISKILTPQQLEEVTTSLKEGYVKAAKKSLIPTPPPPKGRRDNRGIRKFLAPLKRARNK